MREYVLVSYGIITILRLTRFVRVLKNMLEKCPFYLVFAVRICQYCLAKLCWMPCTVCFTGTVPLHSQISQCSYNNFIIRCSVRAESSAHLNIFVLASQRSDFKIAFSDAVAATAVVLKFNRMIRSDETKQCYPHTFKTYHCFEFYTKGNIENWMGIILADNGTLCCTNKSNKKIPRSKSANIRYHIWIVRLTSQMPF